MIARYAAILTLTILSNVPAAQDDAAITLHAPNKETLWHWHFESRASDFTVAPDGRKAWACGGKKIHCIDLLDGKKLGEFGAFNHASRIHYQPADGMLYVVDEDLNGRNGHKGAFVTVLDPVSQTEARSFLIEDSRLYRVAHAAFSADGKWLWLMSHANMNARYGYVPPAFFRVDLKNEKWVPIVALTSEELHAINRVDPLGKNTPRESTGLVADASGNALVIGLKPDTIQMYPTNGKEPAWEIPLGFKPSLLCFGAEGQVLVAGAGRIGIVDIVSKNVVRTVEFEGAPTAMHFSAQAGRVFMGFEKVNAVKALNLVTGKFDALIDVERKRWGERHGGYSPEVTPISKLSWHDNPPRLVGLGFTGYVAFVRRLDDKIRNAPLEEFEGQEFEKLATKWNIAFADLAFETMPPITGKGPGGRPLITARLRAVSFERVRDGARYKVEVNFDEQLTPSAYDYDWAREKDRIMKSKIVYISESKVEPK